MKDLKSHVERMEHQLKDLGVKLDELVVQSEAAEKSATGHHDMSLEDIKTRYADAQLKLTELKSAGGDKWEGFKFRLDSAWSELEHAFKELRN